MIKKIWLPLAGIESTYNLWVPNNTIIQKYSQGFWMTLPVKFHCCLGSLHQGLCGWCECNKNRRQCQFNLGRFFSCVLYMILGRGRTLQKSSWYHFQMAPKLDSRHLMKGSSEFLLCFGWMHDRSYRLMLYLAVTERILHSLLSFVSFQPCCMSKPIDWLQLKQ